MDAMSPAFEATPDLADIKGVLEAAFSGKITITGDRGNPINSQPALEAAIAQMPATFVLMRSSTAIARP